MIDDVSSRNIFNKAEEKLNIVKSVILASSDLRIFGCLLYKFEISLAYSKNNNTGQYPTAFVFYNDKIKRFHMIYFIEFVNSTSINDLVYIICHEILHVLNNHLSRGVRLIKEIYNIATDHVINTSLDEDVNHNRLRGASKPNDRIIIKTLLNKDMTSEDVYKYLLDNSTYTSETIKFKIKSDSNGNVGIEPGDDCDQNSNSNSNGNVNDNDEIEIELKKIKIELSDGQRFEILMDFETNNQNEEGVKEQESNLQSETRRLLNSSLFDNKKTKGDNTSSVLELIKKAIDVPIPWEKLLEKVIKTNITEISDNKTWKRVNKRMLASQKHIMPYYDLEEQYDNLLVITDTSGSISRVELEKFTSVVKAAMYHFKHVIKIDHDSKIYIDARKEFDQTNIDLLIDEGIEYTGRGGTSHRPVYNFIEDIYNQVREEIPIPGLILFLTDFESDIDEIHDKYEWPKEIPYKYIVSGNKNLKTTVDDPIIID